MPGAKRARVCRGLGGGRGGRGELGPQPLPASCKKGARPEAEESNPAPFSPKITGETPGPYLCAM